jgi:uncharacterized protein (DUF305 family)
MNNFILIRKQILIFVISLFIFSSIFAEDQSTAPPIVQPGAPGEETKDIDIATASEIADTSFTSDDVEFMQGMILHHHQAMIMSDMAVDRTNSISVLDLNGTRPRKI